VKEIKVISTGFLPEDIKEAMKKSRKALINTDMIVSIYSLNDMWDFEVEVFKVTMRNGEVLFCLDSGLWELKGD
jgi:hypothetical protein